MSASIIFKIDYLCFTNGLLMFLGLTGVLSVKIVYNKEFAARSIWLSLLFLALYQFACFFNFYYAFIWISYIKLLFFTGGFFSLLVFLTLKFMPRLKFFPVLYLLIIALVAGVTIYRKDAGAAQMYLCYILAFPVTLSASAVLFYSGLKLSGRNIKEVIVPGLSMGLYSLSWIFLYSKEQQFNSGGGKTFLIVLAGQLIAVLFFGLWYLYRWFIEIQQAGNSFAFYVVIISIATVIAGGAVFTGWKEFTADGDLRMRLLRQARGISYALAPENIRKLKFTEDDRTNPGYQIIRQQMKIWGEYTGVKSIYSMALIDGKLIFGPENIPENDPMSSSPGTEYLKPAPQFLQVFEDELPGTMGPYTDEYGTFVSGYAPVIDYRTGKVILVVGVDMNASEWLSEIRAVRLKVMIEIFLIVSVLILAGILLNMRDTRWSGRAGFFYIYMEGVFIFISGVILSFYIFSLFRHLEERKELENFIYVSDSSAGIIRDTLRNINSDLDELTRFFQNSEVVTLDEFISFISEMDVGVATSAGWVPAVMNHQRSGFEKSVRREGHGVSGIHRINNQGKKVPAAEFRIYYPIRFFSPIFDSRLAPGIDLLSMPNYRTGLISSMESGSSVMADYSIIRSGGIEKKMIYVIRPVYKKTGAPPSGFTLISADLNQALAYAMSFGKSRSGKIPADISDIATGGGERMLAGYFPSVEKPAPEKIMDVNTGYHVYPIFIFSRVFGIKIYQPNRFHGKSAPAALMGGVSILFLAAALSLFAVVMKRRAFNLEEEVRIRSGELIESEERFRILSEASYGGIAIHDNGIIVECNEGLAAMSGYSIEELTGMNGLNLIAPEYRDFVLGQITSGVETQYDSFSKKKDGSIFPVEIHGRSIPYKGKILRVTEFRDITERKKTEELLRTQSEEIEAVNEELQAQMEEYEALNDELVDNNRSLRESEEKFSRSFNINPSVMSLIDLSSLKYIDVNDAFLKIFELERDSVIGRTPDELGISSELHYRKKMGELMASEGYVRNFETIINKPSGEKLYGLVSLDIIMLNGKECLLNVFTDITDRKRFETALEESEKKYRFLFEVAGDAIVFMERDVFIDCNKKAEEIFGCPREELVGSTPLRFLPEFQSGGVYSEEMAGRKLDAAYRGIPQYFEWIHRKLDGTIFDAEVSLNTFEIEGKQYIIGITRDVSERKKIEVRLSHMEKMDAIGQLAGGVAHDFNNQLSGILGYAEILSARLVDNPLKKYSDGIISSAMRSADLTKKLLAFARKGQFQQTPVDINDLIDETIEMLEHSIDRRITIIRKTGSNPAIIKGDAAQLQNALLNLGLNARDAMPEGGTLTFETEKLYVNENTRNTHLIELEQGSYIAVYISDTGTGIPPGLRNRIFEPFFTTKESGRGTGMGLASVYGTVKSHNGSIDVYSELGYGSVFRIYLPLCEDETAEVDMNSNDEGISVPRINILLVDDEDAVRNTLVELLTDMGHHVIEASNGKKGVELYREHWEEIDIVIIDMIMPDISGHDAFLEMKGVNPSIRSILSSGFSMDHEARSMLADGVMGFIHKPYRRSELLNKIIEVLNIGKKQTPS